jgi:CHASE2 domain-containing sensor protein
LQGRESNAGLKNEHLSMKFPTLLHFQQAWFTGKGRLLLRILAVAALVGHVLSAFQGEVEAWLDGFTQSALAHRQQSTFADCLQPQSVDGGCIYQVVITNDEFEADFLQRSPLDPARLALILDKLKEGRPLAVGIDLDLAPVAGEPAAPRELLTQSVLRLGSTAPVILVAPQSSSIQRTSPEEARWMSRVMQGSKVAFAKSELDPRGLYYNLQESTFGVALARAAQQAAGSAVPKADKVEQKAIIKPADITQVTTRDLISDPDIIAGRVVVLGGTYGVGDRFYLRSLERPVHGVTVHSWIVRSELSPPSRLPKGVLLLIDFAIGTLTGWLARKLLSQIGRRESGFACRGGCYLLLLALIVATPVACLYAAIMLAEYGITASVAGVATSMVIDRVLSPHEYIKQDEAQTDTSLPHRKAAALFSSVLPCAGAIIVAMLGTHAMTTQVVGGLPFALAALAWAGTLTILVALRKVQKKSNITPPPLITGWDRWAYALWLGVLVAFMGLSIYGEKSDLSGVAIMVGMLLAIASDALLASLGFGPQLREPMTRTRRWPLSPPTNASPAAHARQGSPAHRPRPAPLGQTAGATGLQTGLRRSPGA